MNLLLLGLFSLLCAVVCSQQGPDECGCTTTTTCAPSGSSNSVGRPGKQGPKGSKGNKGEKGDAEHNSIDLIQQMGQKIERLEDDLTALQSLFYSFPSTCAEYHQYETDNRTFQMVPLYYVNNAEEGALSTPVIANCKKVPELSNVQGGVSLQVPRNSLRGRKLIFEGIPRYKGNRNWINVIYRKSEDQIPFILVIRMEIPEVVRNDRTTGAGWGEEEKRLPVSFPFTYNVPFKLEITVTDIEYHIKLNERYLVSFKSRQLPTSEVNEVEIPERTADITFVSFN